MFRSDKPCKDFVSDYSDYLSLRGRFSVLPTDEGRGVGHGVTGDPYWKVYMSENLVWV